MRREFLHFLCSLSIFHERTLVYQKSYLVNSTVTRNSVGAAISLVGIVRQPQALHTQSGIFFVVLSDSAYQSSILASQAF